MTSRTNSRDSAKPWIENSRCSQPAKDIRNMMAARNLHIVDVVDTDSKGRTKAAFGRVFFAEDKQLVFYAL